MAWQHGMALAMVARLWRTTHTQHVLQRLRAHRRQSTTVPHLYYKQTLIQTHLEHGVLVGLMEVRVTVQAAHEDLVESEEKWGVIQVRLRASRARDSASACHRSTICSVTASGSTLRSWSIHFVEPQQITLKAKLSYSVLFVACRGCDYCCCSRNVPHCCRYLHRCHSGSEFVCTAVLRSRPGTSSAVVIESAKHSGSALRIEVISWSIHTPTRETRNHFDTRLH